MTPEHKARVSIDALLQQAGWHVCNVADANILASTRVLHATKLQELSASRPSLVEQVRIFAEVDRHLSVFCEAESEVDVNLQRAQALRQSTLAKAFSVGVANG